MVRGQGRFGSETRMLGAATAAEMLGCNWFEVAPGKSAFPRHYRCGVEEAVFVLEGPGALQIGEAEVRIEAGDYITFLAGPDDAHAVKNRRRRSAPLPMSLHEGEGRCSGLSGLPKDRRFRVGERGLHGGPVGPKPVP